ncbi:hypothetical protein M440DRAFT_1401004 [Trichoderma longibrachiatum ATCC 18648]|uniref:Uncharacterized protein n=1 Tax=Trichoderma longibrachiatum ATCC 18648 TaxID=983965 RepID=A0A2T4C508_TRILO|nr:hypothetical protein M440DRAFT_1401004 [Trichoderma longibrachiatum ATCC 18648]
MPVHVPHMCLQTAVNQPNPHHPLTPRRGLVGCMSVPALRLCKPQHDPPLPRAAQKQ